MPLPWSVRSTPPAVAPQACLCLFLLAHPVAQALRPHVDPHLVDVGEALAARAGLADVLPARLRRLVERPDRVLLLLVHDHGVLVRHAPDGTRFAPFRVILPGMPFEARRLVENFA